LCCSSAASVISVGVPMPNLTVGEMPKSSSSVWSRVVALPR
jgi:hypothetical protein